MWSVEEWALGDVEYPFLKCGMVMLIKRGIEALEEKTTTTTR